MNTWSPRMYCRKCGADITWRGPHAVLCGDCRTTANLPKRQEG